MDNLTARSPPGLSPYRDRRHLGTNQQSMTHCALFLAATQLVDNDGIANPQHVVPFSLKCRASERNVIYIGKFTSTLPIKISKGVICIHSVQLRKKGLDELAAMPDSDILFHQENLDSDVRGGAFAMLALHSVCHVIGIMLLVCLAQRQPPGHHGRGA